VLHLKVFSGSNWPADSPDIDIITCKPRGIVMAVYIILILSHELLVLHILGLLLMVL
jgi:hypothetical protein